MKIVGIDVRLWNQTGVGRYIRNLIENLEKIDNKNEYVLFARSEDYEEIKNKITNDKLQIVKTDIKWHSVSEQIKFANVLKKENLDLVHFPYFSVPIFYNKPYIVTIHDLIIHHFSTGKASTLTLPIYMTKLFAYKYVIKKAAQNAKKIIAVSNATKEEIVDHLGVEGEKVEVVYNGIDKNFLKGTKDKKLIKEPYFLYVGNAYPHKNLENLIFAFENILKTNKNVKLVLVGNKDYFYQRLKEKVNSLNMQEAIVFYEKADDKSLVNLYQNALALVMPSLMEGFGLPVLEAMSNRCLVLVSDIPSLREICQNNAIFFDPKNIADIYKNLELVIKNPKIKEKFTEGGYKRSLLFSWEKSARETLRIYEGSFSL